LLERLSRTLVDSPIERKNAGEGVFKALSKEMGKTAGKRVCEYAVRH